MDTGMAIMAALPALHELWPKLLYMRATLDADTNRYCFYSTGLATNSQKEPKWLEELERAKWDCLVRKNILKAESTEYESKIQYHLRQRAH